MSFLKGITEINISLYANSWGSLQCNAYTDDGKKYHSWTGQSNLEVTRQMIIDALDLIEEQIILSDKAIGTSIKREKESG